MCSFSIQGNLDETELPRKQKTDVCTIMYTSGTTGEPKGVILKNAAIMVEVLSIDKMLQVTDRSVISLFIYVMFVFCCRYSLVSITINDNDEHSVLYITISHQQVIICNQPIDYKLNKIW